jgi:hypothetical protein
MIVDMAPYIECPDCAGRGYVKAHVEEATRLRTTEPNQKTVIRDHDRCNGAGILILREPSRKGNPPYYGAPRL